MSPLASSSKDSLQSTYGWDVELICSQCKYTGQPRYEGWSSSLKTNLNANITIYAKVACPKCGRRLTDEAGRKLLELFSGQQIREENQKIISQFIAGLILVPAALAFVLFFGMQMDWWGWGLGSIWILLMSGIAIPLLASQKRRRLAQLLTRCNCGKPHYVFMGMADNNYCYRCFTCSTLLKVQE